MLRPYVKTTRSAGNGTNLITKTWPKENGAIVLYIGNKFRIEGSSTEYTVTTNNVTTDSNGEATILNFSPVLSATASADTALIVPHQRTVATDLRTEIAKETAIACYFMEFAFEKMGRISAFADGGGGTIVATSTAHGLSTGNSVSVYATKNYNGTYTITVTGADTFTFSDTWVETETGTWGLASNIYLTTAPHDIPWNSKTWQGVGGSLHFESIKEENDLRGAGSELVLSGVDQSLISAILGKASVGRKCNIYLVHINTSGTIVDSPLLIFPGRMNGGFSIEEQRNEDGTSLGTVEIRGSMEHRVMSIDRVNGIMTNEPSHQRFFSDDRFFSEVDNLVGRKLIWGKPEKMKGGSGMCFITSAVVKHLKLSDNCYELNILRQFRDEYILKLPEGNKIIQEYYEIAPLILEHIEKDKNKDLLYSLLYDSMIKEAIRAIELKKFEKAYKIYKGYIERLKNLYAI